MPPKHLAYLRDIVDSIGLIRSYTDGMSADEYQKNVQVRDAVERRFAVIGEALNRLKRDAPDVHATIDHTAEIAAFRNIIIHVYDQLDHAIVWKVIQTDLALLSQQAQAAIDLTD
jgi:uncharacterized protein with HEPN domain